MAYIHYGLRHTADGFYTQDPDYQCIVDGDLKPEQFFLDWSEHTAGMPNIVLGDFGQAKIMGGPAIGGGIGTPGLQAPEQLVLINASVDVDLTIFRARTPACDIYTIGLMIYVLDVQQIPHRNGEWLVGQNEDLLQLTREHGLRDIVYSCLRVDPANRRTASFDKPNGILELTNNMRKVRDKYGHAITEPTDPARPSL